VSGSVAAIKTKELYDLLAVSYNVRVVTTNSGMNFVRNLNGIGEMTIYQDEEEWKTWRSKGDKVLHIELRKWADGMIIAPLSANTLAKIANGICDNLLTCVVRAWDFEKPLLLAPAMNTFMWKNPLTKKQLEVCTDLGFIIASPISKRLACGDVGEGAMAEPSEITSMYISITNSSATNVKSISLFHIK
jgi:phosphopantothenoylcysteine decarboxylase